MAAIDVQSILNLELEPKVKPIPLPSPTFPIPGSADVASKPPLSPEPPASPTPHLASPPSTPETPIEEVSKSVGPPVPEKELQTATNVEDVSNTDDASATKNGEHEDETSTNRFYTPDEDENEEEVSKDEPVFVEPESVSYVPPFNNPIYPNDSFTSYTSAIGK